MTDHTAESSGTTTQSGGQMFPIRPVGSTDDLELVAERGEGSRTLVNRFLEAVGHPRGGVQFWHFAWTARTGDSIVAAIVLERPSSRHQDDGDTVEITRLAARPERPHNTCSWLIARARKWADLSGYDRILAYAGIGDNYGTVYEAAGFEQEGDAVVSDGSGWTTQDETRDTWADYERRRWVDDLSGWSP